MMIRMDANDDTIFYQVKSGDNLSAIIKKYHGNISLEKQKNILHKILAKNPEIKNPNVIYPGQILALDISQNYFAVPGFPKAPVIHADEAVAEILKQTLQKTTPHENGLFSAIAPVMLGTGTTGMMMINQTFTSNTPLLAEMVENYNDYKADMLSKGQYDYRRKTLLNRLKTKLGPTNILLNGSKSPNEVLRISRKKGSVPTQAMTQQINHMGRLSKLASKGGIVLSVAGLGVACHQIANTDDKQQKNEILVESIFGVAGGVLFGATVTVLLVGTPVGWLAALAIGVSGALSGYTSGKIAEHIYTTTGSRIDFVSDLGVGRICK